MLMFSLANDFKKELFYIKDKNNKKMLTKLLEGLPKYFYHTGAHEDDASVAEYCRGIGGKVRETKVAVRIAHELLEDPVIGGDFTDREKDLMLMSIMLHDGFEKGVIGGEEVLFEHPILIAEYVKHTNVGLPLDDRDFICSMVEAHSGINNTSEYSDRRLPLPLSKYQKFVYMCINLARMKFLEIDFNGNREIEK